MSVSANVEENASSKKIEFAALRQHVIKQLMTRPDKIMIGGIDFDFDFGELNDFYKKKAKEELREIPENIEMSLKEIRKLVKGEPDLYVLDDDEFYTIFLRTCKWCPQSAFLLMKRHYRFKQNYPHIFHNLLPSEEKTLLSSSLVYPLPHRNRDGARVIVVIGGKKWKPKQVTLDQIFKAVIFNTSAATIEPKTQISGAHVIIDMDGLSLSQIVYFTPSFAKMVTDYIQNCLPIHIKTFNIVNQPFLFNMIFAIFQPFLEEKTRKRIFFHGTNRESLFTNIDKNILTSEYGGTLNSISDNVGDSLWKMFNAFDDIFAVQNNLGYKTAGKKK